MTNIRQIHRYMTDRKQVLLNDGRTGKVVRVDTEFPEGMTTVSLWTGTERDTAVTKVTLDSVVGPAPMQSSAA